MKRIVPGLFRWLSVIGALGLLACHPTPSAKAPSETNDIRTMVRQLASIESSTPQLEGWVLLDFWATWCAECKKQLPAVDALAAKYGTVGVSIVGVHVGGERADVSSFVSRVGVHYPVLHDEQLQLSQALNIREIPALVLLNAQGQVEYQSRSIDAALLEKLDHQLARQNSKIRDQNKASSPAPM